MARGITHLPLQAAVAVPVNSCSEGLGHMNRAVSSREVTFLCALILIVSAIAAGPAKASFALQSAVIRDSIQSSLPPQAMWAFAASDLDNGKAEITIGNASESSLVPASLVKLIVTAAALELDAQAGLSLDTVVSIEGVRKGTHLSGNVYLRGMGNAFLSGADLKAAAEAISSAGIRSIKGDVIVDDSYFHAPQLKTVYGDPAHAPCSALGLDMHTVAVSVSEGAPRIEPPNELVQFTSAVSGRPGIRKINDLSYEITGKSDKTAPLKQRFPLDDPALFSGGVLKTWLKKAGVVIEGTVRKGKLPPSATEIHRTSSGDVASIVSQVNHHSLNAQAGNLFLVLGARKFGEPGDADKGRAAIETFLADHGINRARLRITEGAGLSHDNRVAAGELVAFLRMASGQPWFRAFYESLPSPGKGTLKDMPPSKRLIRAKTGRLNDVFSIAGYVTKRDGGRIAFAYIVNVPGADLVSLAEAGQLIARLADGAI